MDDQPDQTRLPNVDDNQTVDDGGLETDGRALCKKYEQQGKEVLVLVAGQGSCQWFGSETAMQFVNLKYHFIFKFFSFCQGAYQEAGDEVKVELDETRNPAPKVPYKGALDEGRNEVKVQLEVLKNPAPRALNVTHQEYSNNDSDAVEDFDHVEVGEDDSIDSQLDTDGDDACADQLRVQLKEQENCSEGETQSKLCSRKAAGPKTAILCNLRIENSEDSDTGSDDLASKVVEKYFGNKCEKKHACSKCGARFVHAEHLRTHERKRVSCGETNFVERYTNAAILETEVTFKHPETGEMITSTYQAIMDNRKPDTEKNFRCVFCDKKYKTQYDLGRHIISHNMKPLYECNICNFHFRLPQMLVYHTREHLVKPYECDTCPRRFKSDKDRQSHVLTKCHGSLVVGVTDNSAGSDNLNCDKCNYKAANSILLKAHLDMHNGQKGCVCALCGRHLISMTSLMRHLQYVHQQSRPFRCDICYNKTFKDKAGLTRHQRTHGDKVHNCELCDKAFSDKCNLKAHMKTHSQEKPFVCDFCGKAYRKKIGFDNHRRLHTGDRPYKCDHQGCNKTFRSSGALDQHKNVHKTEAHICEFCGRRFKQPKALSHHRKSHTTEWRWSCPYCPEKYKSIWTFKRHLAHFHPDRKADIEQNLNIKLYQCPICPKVHHDSEDYKRHINNHNGIRPFSCKECGKSFSDRSNLRAHALSHSGGKKFRCQVCHKKFIHEKNLLEHLDRKHSKLSDVEFAVNSEQGPNSSFIVPENDYEIAMAPLQILE